MNTPPPKSPPSYDELVRAGIGAADMVFHPDPALSAEGTPNIDVYFFRARSVRYSLLVTGGASSRPMPGVREGWIYPKRFELYCRLSAKIVEPAEIKGVATRLWMAAQGPFVGKQRPLGHWQLCGELPPFTENSELTAWLLAPPLTEDTPVQSYQFELSEKVGTAALIHAIGITEAERAVGEQLAKRDRKLDGFADQLLERAGVYTHTNRMSADLTDLLDVAALH